jgi:hypothetical protein
VALLEANWPIEFGIEALRQPEFFRNSAELDACAEMPPYAHVVRRAFRDLKLDGVLCETSGPIAYFKAIRGNDAENLAALHRLFWNHGGAPILIVIGATSVYIYSSFERPSVQAGSRNDLAGLIETLDRSACQ